MIKILDKVPKYADFLTVEEINEKVIELGKKECVEIFNVGKSENGVNILGLKIGVGERKGVLYGFPHPNEPVGSLTSLFWAECLANNHEHVSDWSWYIIPCIDPDGALLNQGWFKGVFSFEKYCRNFYRQPAEEMIDWNFPVEFEGHSWVQKRKETAALADLLKRLKPDFVYPLHNSGFGGAYFFVSRPLSSSHLSDIVNLTKELGLPLHFGAPEEDFLTEFVKPIYQTFGYADYANHYKKQGMNPAAVLNHGDSGMKFAESLGAFSMVTEIPYFYDERIVNSNEGSKTKKECILEFVKRSIDAYDFIQKIFLSVKDRIDKSSPFYGVLERYVRITPVRLEVRAKEANDAKYDKKATVAEEHDEWLNSYFSKGLILGQFLRIAPNDVCQILEKELIRTIKEFKTHFETIPIKKLVQLQVGCLLLTLQHLKK